MFGKDFGFTHGIDENGFVEKLEFFEVCYSKTP